MFVGSRIGAGTLSAIFICLLLVTSPGAQAQRTELHVFQSITPTDKELLTADKSAKAVMISGQLRIPRPGSDRFPTVVLLHGSGGMGNNVENWSRELLKADVASFAIDSFTGRALLATNNNQDLLSRMTMVVDAYRALDLLSKHPRVDPQRIYLMGFSRGGGAAHWAALRRFQRMYGGAGEFAGFIGLYPTCNRVFQDGLDIVDKPVRIFHGLADDYVPPSRCRELVGRLRERGKDATFTDYPDARHVYDDPGLSPVVNLPN